jgi:NAD(P)-dependent dehydrogenase (short-subunit alcohol dehydrogenase family)
MGLLDGHRAVITGGGSGIGAETGRRMAAEGAQVALFDLNGDNAETIAKEFDGLSYSVDVTDYDALSAAMRDAAEKMDGLSLLYNNAGGSSLSPIHDYDVAEWNRIIQLNLTGVFHGFKAAAPMILANGGGAIVSTASISGTRPAAGEAPYAAAKAAVVALTASAALEYAPTIRVNSVSPGMIRTPLTELLLDQRGIGLEDQQRAKTPLDRVGNPGDIADVVVFLCSNLARFVTGQNLVADGGMTLHGSGVDGVLDVVRNLLSRG